MFEYFQYQHFNGVSYQRHSRRLALLHGLLLESCVLLVNCFHIYLHRHAKTIDIITGALFAEGNVSIKEICNPDTLSKRCAK